MQVKSCISGLWGRNQTPKWCVFVTWKERAQLAVFSPQNTGLGGGGQLGDGGEGVGVQVGYWGGGGEGRQGAWTPIGGGGPVALFPKAWEAGMHQAELNV